MLEITTSTWRFSIWRTAFNINFFSSLSPLQ